MMKTIAIFLYFLWTTCFADTAFDEYHNARFNYQVSYPTFLIPSGEGANGDGQSFKGKNAVLTVYGSFFPNLDSQKDDEHFDLTAEFNYESDELKNKGYKIDYTLKKPESFVISGENNDQIVYLKKVFIQACGVHIYLWLYYPKAEKTAWDPWVTEISKSFNYSTSTCSGDYKVTE